MRLLIDDDPVLSRKRYLHVSGDGKYTMETVSDVENVIEMNKEIAKDLDGKGFRGDGIHHIGQVPLVILETLKTQGILGPGYEVLDQKKFAAWLNDPDNRYFRTRKAI